MDPLHQDVGVDRDFSRRPGTPRFWQPRRWQYARADIPQQRGTPSVAKQGRPLKPVFSTAIPPKGVSGWMRKTAYRIPEHRPNHWLLLLAADRVEVWGRRLPWLLAFAAPALAFGAFRASPALRWRMGWAAAKRAPRMARRMAACAMR